MKQVERKHLKVQEKLLPIKCLTNNGIKEKNGERQDLLGQINCSKSLIRVRGRINHRL